MKKNLVYFIMIFLFFISILLVGNFNNEHKISKEDTHKSDVVSEKAKELVFIEDVYDNSNVLSFITNSKDHSTLTIAIKAAKLENSLLNAGPLTVFAPTNEAFNKLPANTVSNLLKKENIENLAFILKHHVTPGNYSKDFIKKFKKLGQASNENISVNVKGDFVYAEGAKIIKSSRVSNGIVHTVDKVILP